MKKQLITLMMTTFWMFSCDAKITGVNTMKEVFEQFTQVDAKTWAIFDIDMVLIQPSDPAFQMPNVKRFGPVCKRIVQNLSPEKKRIFLDLMTVSSDPILVDASTPSLLQELRDKGAAVMALTASFTGSFGSIDKMETWRTQHLRRLGIDFSRSAPYAKSLSFNHLASFRGNFPSYIDGVLFVNGKAVSKGEAFLAFIEQTQLLPERVIFVDDLEENLKSVEEAIQTLGKPIEYHGLHYHGAKEYPSQQISEKEFESRWQALAEEALGIE